MMLWSIFVTKDLLVPKPPKEVNLTIVEGDEEATVAVEPEAAGLKERRKGVRREQNDAPGIEA